jgi:GDP-L-fucose synthase
MTTIVTGGSGMVGSNLKELCPNFIYLSSKDADLTDMIAVQKVFEKYQPKYVIHLAASVGGLYKNMNNNYNMFDDNLMINRNVITCCRKYNVTKLIACLSTCIYPNKIEYPITEEKLHLGPPHYSNEGYSYAKRMLEVQCRLSGIDYICLIPTNLYGKYDNFNLQDAHVLPNLIHKCFLAKKSNDVFEIKGSGIAQRQFLYAKDFAKIIKFFITSNSKNETFICSPSEKDEIKIKECVEKISSNMNYNNIKYNTSYSDGQLKKTVANNKLMNVIGNFNFTDFNIGLSETVEWFTKNYNVVRK